MYSNLVLSGGGIRGIALLGSLHYLEEIKMINKINTFIGTSAGAIILFFYIIGYSSNEVKNILINELDYVTNINFENITELIDTYGIDNTDKNKEVLEKYLLKKTKKKEMTFIEFTKKFGKNFIITGTNITKNKLEYFSIDTYPNMNIITALLITSCVPILYSPITFNESLFIDGGVYNNFPIDSNFINPKQTIGVYLDNNYIIENNNFFSYIINIVFSLMNKLSYDKLESNNYNVCCIKFDNSSKNDFNFSFDTMKLKVEKKILSDYFDKGYEIFKEYYNKETKKLLRIFEDK